LQKKYKQLVEESKIIPQENIITCTHITKENFYRIFVMNIKCPRKDFIA
jgi:hypothetical protein